MQSADEAPGYWQRLSYRWFVEYNPLYLLSAALVLGGVTLVTRGLARDATAFELVGVGAIPELYAALLIAGVALLTRAGSIRPAVLLALIAILYQGDLTLHTETCAYLGWVGVAGTAAWAGMFVAKLYALAWALKLQLSRAAVFVAAFGALGAATLPHYLGVVPASTMTPVVALWLFSLFAAALWSARRVKSAVPLDAWGRTVKRRALGAAWAAWTLLLLVHVHFWYTAHRFGVAWLLPMLLLLSTRWVRSELRVWGLVSGTLLLVFVELPATLSLSALMAAGVLCLRAYRQPQSVTFVTAAPPRGPYRALVVPGAVPHRSVSCFAPTSREARMRLVAGALSCAYLAIWVHGWSGGAWPAHSVALDVLFALALVVAARKARRWPLLLPALGSLGHAAFSSGIIPVPRTVLAWGISATAFGFGLLLVSLWISYRLRLDDSSPPAVAS